MTSVSLISQFFGDLASVGFVIMVVLIRRLGLLLGRGYT